MKTIYKYLKQIVGINWRAYAVLLVGFFMATFSQALAIRYGVYVGLVSLVGGWVLCLTALTLQEEANKFNTIWHIFGGK